MTGKFRSSLSCIITRLIPSIDSVTQLNNCISWPHRRAPLLFRLLRLPAQSSEPHLELGREVYWTIPCNQSTLPAGVVCTIDSDLLKWTVECKGTKKPGHHILCSVFIVAYSPSLVSVRRGQRYRSISNIQNILTYRFKKKN
jgi:hypothetical protein